MLKIVHFGKFYFPESGGIESVTFCLARGAAKAGHNVKVICFTKLPTGKVEFIDGVKIIRSPVVKLLASQPLGWRYVRFCLSEARDADVVHMHAPNMLAALCCLFLRKETSLLVHWHSDVINKGLLGRMLRPLENALLQRADLVVATSQVYADASPTLKAFRHKVALIPIGVPDSKQNYDWCSGGKNIPDSLSSKLVGKQLILSVGRLVPYKGFDVLIKAAKILRDEAIVVIVGGGPLKSTLEAAICAADVSDRVHLAGRLSDEVLHALFSRATIYCLPSVERSEAFGVVLLEAMAFGLPIVATNIPGSGVPWVNQNEVSGLNVPLGDPIALAQACNQLLSSERKHALLSKGARQRFLNEFTEDIFVKRIMTVYRSLAYGSRHFNV